MNYTILPATLRLCLVSILVFLIASPISAPLADDNTTEDFEAAYRQMADDKTRAFLNDLSTRRRVTTLFANKQSLHAGVQENFVNTSRGNLTFLIRDLVRIGGLPIILGRVYDSTTTRAVDALGRSTTFHRTQAGLTDAIADATGSITEVTFDDSFRPQSVTRDGLTVAQLFYDTQGRLIQLSRPDGNATFTYNRYGVTTIDSTESSAEYRYDVAGRLILAADNKGNRAYEYHGNGTLQHVTIDGHETQLESSLDGIVKAVSNAGKTLVSYTHAPDGSITEIVYGDDEYTAHYAYNRHGFRETMNYTEEVSASIRYDSAGNLVHYAVDTPDGNTLTQDYEIGNFNEVLGIRNGVGADLTFEYDDIGRVYAVQADTRSLTISYDDLDRATRVTLDEDVLVEYDYNRLKLDAVHRGDRLTSDVVVTAGTSGVFGTMDLLVYTRPRAMDYGVVGYVADLKTFEVNLDHLQPDAILL